MENRGEPLVWHACRNRLRAIFIAVHNGIMASMTSPESQDATSDISGAAGVPEPLPAPSSAHSLFEDGYALAVGCILIAVGLAMLRAVGLVTGGMAGLALLLSHYVPITPGVLFAMLNIPFFALAARVMGGWFTLKTIAVSIGIAALPFLIQETTQITSGSPALAAVAGGTLLGMGTLSLARHGAGVGGTGVVTLWLQDSRGWNAGRTQILLDLVILGASALTLPLDRLLWSTLSAIAMSNVVYLWHRPGRYNGFSAAPGRKVTDRR